MTTERCTDTNTPGYHTDGEETHTKRSRTQSLGFLPRQLLLANVGWHQWWIILPETWTGQCQEGSESSVPVFRAGADLDCPRTSPFTWAPCSWHPEETKLETVEFLQWLLLTQQARDPTEEFMVVLAEEDSLLRFQPPGGQMRSGLVYRASPTKQLGELQPFNLASLTWRGIWLYHTRERFPQLIPCFVCLFLSSLFI